MDGTQLDFEILESRELSRGFFRFEELHLRHRRFDGGVSRVLSRELLHIGGTVIVLPYDCQRDEVLLIEQFRAGGAEMTSGPWMIECVAGLLGADEVPIEAALRELQEETGLQASRLEEIGHYAPNPAVTTEFANMFVADAMLEGVGGVHGLVEEDEDIRSFVVKAEQAFAWIDEGRVICANALMPLRWLQVHRNELRERWQKAAAD